MPIYVYECPECRESTEEWNRVDDRESSAPACCGGQMKIVIQPVRGKVQSECNYECPKTGQRVTSWSQRRNIMAEHNLVDANDLTPDYVFRRQRERRDALRREAAAMDMPDVDLTPYIPKGVLPDGTPGRVV